jgi:SAM-dependent methyltransferase
VTDDFGEEYWEDRYRRHAEHGSRRPSPQLVAEVADLPPGTALEAGCGEGANAVWLAGSGWRVTAVDISATALRRAREYAASVGAGVEGRIDWVVADLTVAPPVTQSFDLVTAHYVHPAGPFDELVRSLADAVAPGGTLLVVVTIPPIPTPRRMPRSASPSRRKRSRPASTPLGGRSRSPRAGAARTQARGSCCATPSCARSAEPSPCALRRPPRQWLWQSRSRSQPPRRRGRPGSAGARVPQS